MNNRNLAEQHAEVLCNINSEFELSKTIFENDDLIFDTDALSYWMIKKEDNLVYVSPKNGTMNFNVKTIKNGVEQEFDILVYSEKLVNKFRSLDLTYAIAECFDIENHKPEGDLTENEQEKFFDLSIRYLNLLGDDPCEVLKDTHPKQLNSIACADMLYDFVQSSLLTFKHNQEALDEMKLILKEYEEKNKVNRFDRQKLNLMLDRTEKIADKFAIN